VTLVHRVAEALRRRQIPFAIIGASALAAHGVSRSTFDIDMLTTDVRVLDESTWREVGAAVDMRRGDADDPLAGIVRLTADGERDVDIVVGRSVWQQDIILRARTMAVADAELPVADAPGLVLLKLYAGGMQDAWDIAQLLEGPERDAITARVDCDVAALPADARELWQRLRTS
jgi:predicted nucleotidyltransferase